MANGISDEERETYLYRLQTANLPGSVRKLTSSQLGSDINPLLDYTKSPGYTWDIQRGVGVCLSGNAARRSAAFALLAKPLAMEGRGVFFCSLHFLISALETDSDRRSMILGTDHLFVDTFEQDFRPHHDCPYTFGQRADVQEFLLLRLRAGRRVTNFSACYRWAKLQWWSADFIEEYHSRVIDVSLLTHSKEGDVNVQGLLP